MVYLRAPQNRFQSRSPPVPSSFSNPTALVRSEGGCQLHDARQLLESFGVGRPLRDVDVHGRCQVVVVEEEAWSEKHQKALPRSLSGNHPTKMAFPPPEKRGRFV